MTYFPTNVMKLILSYNDNSAQRAERKRVLEPILEAGKIKKAYLNLKFDYWSSHYRLEYNRIIGESSLGAERLSTLILRREHRRKYRTCKADLFRFPTEMKYILKEELTDYCRTNKIKGYSKYNKKDLYTYIIKYDFNYKFNCLPSGC